MPPRHRWTFWVNTSPSMAIQRGSPFDNRPALSPVAMRRAQCRATAALGADRRSRSRVTRLCCSARTMALTFGPDGKPTSTGYDSNNVVSQDPVISAVAVAIQPARGSIAGSARTVGRPRTTSIRGSTAELSGQLFQIPVASKALTLVTAALIRPDRHCLRAGWQPAGGEWRAPW